MAFAVDGREHVAIAAGSSLYTFGCRESGCVILTGAKDLLKKFSAGWSD